MLQVDLKLLLYLNLWVLVLKLVFVLYVNTFVGALMTCLDEKDEEMVLLLFPSIFNLNLQCVEHSSNELLSLFLFHRMKMSPP